MYKFKYWLPFFAWCVIIYIFSSIPSLHTRLTWDFTLRKIAHIVEYLVLSALLYWALKNSFNLKPVLLYLLLIITVLFYAITDEFHQTHVHGRYGTYKDVLVDMIGVAIFLVIIATKKKKKRDKKTS